MNREVLEFIIVPPYEQRAAVAAAKDRFEDYLSSQFPGYTFRIGPFAPVGDDEAFWVLPIMNFMDDEGKMRMCQEPSRWLLRDIAQACAEVDVSSEQNFTVRGLRPRHIM